MTGCKGAFVMLLVYFEVSTTLILAVNMKEAFVPHSQLVLSQTLRTAVDCANKVGEALD